MCLYSKLIINPKYKSTKKNNGIIPTMTDQRVKYVPIGCGKCIECTKKKAREWQVRLLEDIRVNKNGIFITLTFSDQSIAELNKEVDEKLEGFERDNQIATIAMRRFLERWRKKFKRSLRHWTITELGHKNTENLHLHGIIWTTETIETIAQIWHYGYIWPKNEIERRRNYINERTISYITKYITKKNITNKTYKPIILTSPGIGNNYTNTFNSKLNKYNNNKTIETYRTNTGHTIALPIYWKNKIYTENERENLWIEKLNKEERWVCGERVSIKDSYKEYDELIKWYRKLNQQLGYGTDEKDMGRVEYERQRRRIAILTRINRVAFGNNPKPPAGFIKRNMDYK